LYGDSECGHIEKTEMLHFFSVAILLQKDN